MVRPVAEIAAITDLFPGSPYAALMKCLLFAWAPLGPRTPAPKKPCQRRLHGAEATYARQAF